MAETVLTWIGVGFAGVATLGLTALIVIGIIMLIKVMKDL